MLFGKSIEYIYINKNLSRLRVTSVQISFEVTRQISLSVAKLDKIFTSVNGGFCEDGPYIIQVDNENKIMFIRKSIEYDMNCQLSFTCKMFTYFSKLILFFLNIRTIFFQARVLVFLNLFFQSNLSITLFSFFCSYFFSPTH